MSSVVTGFIKEYLDPLIKGEGANVALVSSKAIQQQILFVQV